MKGVGTRIETQSPDRKPIIQARVKGWLHADSSGGRREWSVTGSTVEAKLTGTDNGLEERERERVEVDGEILSLST